MNCILINSLIVEKKETIAALSKEFGTLIYPLEFCENAFAADKSQSLQNSQLFSQHAFYLQNPSSLLPVVALDPLPGELVLDIAAAPGGKTFHIACKQKNIGEIVANDVSRQRMTKMKKMLDAYGVRIARFISRPGQMLWQHFPNKFDKVLVDAPCTMHGTDTPSSDSSKKISRSQKTLLRSAIACCKPGGVVVYATCTDRVEENEEVIDYVLEKERGVVELQDTRFSQSIPRAVPLVLDSKGKEFAYDTSKVFRVAKTEVFEGFFVATLKKLDMPQKKKHL